MKCDNCGSEDQVVRTQVGNFCREHYRHFKRGKAHPQEVGTVRCDNCGNLVLRGGPYLQCHLCGNQLNADGSVLRIGGHPDC